MRVALGTLDFDDEWREEIARFYGRDGKADRCTCRAWALTIIDGERDTLIAFGGNTVREGELGDERLD